MKKYKIYFDQNIYSHFMGDCDPSIMPGNYQLVYSSANLNEFNRSKYPTKYLDLVRRMEGVYMDSQNNGQTFEFSDKGPHEVFDVYLNRNQQRGFENLPLGNLAAFFASGKNPEAAESDIEEIFELLRRTLSPAEEVFGSDVNSLLSSLKEQAICQLERATDFPESELDFPIMGDQRILDYKGDFPIHEIWSVIKNKNRYSSMDNFFGFEDGYGNEKPVCIAIAECCAMMDRAGYMAEPKRRRSDKFPNIQSDAHHIGFSTQCDYLISSDRKLVARASAIFKYRNILTKAIYISNSEKMNADFLEDIIF